MPIITVQAQPLGPLLTVHIGVSSPRADVLRAAGQPVPVMVTGNFLVDTGASSTCVDIEFIKSLALPKIGEVPITTPSTAQVAVKRDQYDASIIIPGNRIADSFHASAIPIIATALRHSGIDGLIGRDILSRCMLIYNGPSRMVTLAH